MDDKVKTRIEYYLEKLGKWPHVINLAKDFNETQEKAKEWLDEFREKYHVDNPSIKQKVMAPSPAEPVKRSIPVISKEEFEKISSKPEDKPIEQEKEITTVHEAIVQQGGSLLAIRIISGIVSLACIVRGFIVIVQINQVIGWQAYINAIIFQGGSAILPIVGLLYISLTTKKEWWNVLFGLFYLSGGLGSMVYEIYASSQAFHQTNVKQEIENVKVMDNANDPILFSIQERIKQEKTNMGQIVSNLSKRRAELSLLSPDNPEYKTAFNRVSANLSDQSKEQDILNGLGKQETERLLKLEDKSVKQSSVSNLVSNDSFVELIVTLIPSIMMVLFTPVFASIALFGIRRKNG